MRPCLLSLLLFALAFRLGAQDVKLNVTYICSGERMYVESCNVRDLSDTATCQVAHPDRPQHNGFMAYTSETRGSLKKLLPTCTQPTAQQLAAADAFAKRQQAALDAATRKANGTPAPAPQAQSNVLAPSQIPPPKNAEERAMRRCVSSGRLPASCTGNQLLGAFGQMLASVLPTDKKDVAPSSGPDISGVYEGTGGWRVDFIDGGVLVNCTGLSPDQHFYKVGFSDGRAVITIDTAPKPLLLALRPDGSMAGPAGPFVLDGVIASGTTGPDPNARSAYTDKNGIPLTNQQAASSSEVYRGANRVYGSVSPGTTSTNFAHKRVTCSAPVLANKGSTGIQTMQTDLLKSIFSDGEKGAPTPAGIRMHGIYANAATGFSVQFFPESVILGCGPDSARAYPYTVAAAGTHAAIRVDAPDHPLTLVMGSDNSLDPGGTEPYVVHGRIVTGENDNGDFTFAPMEKSCNLGPLTASAAIPSFAGASPTAIASTASQPLSTPAAPTGNAVLTISTGFPPQAGVANPLAQHPYVLLRSSMAEIFERAGINIPVGSSPYKYLGSACQTRTPECQQILAAVNASAASAARSDANGGAVLPGVPPGSYYLMISTIYNKQPMAWTQPIQLKPGANSITLAPDNATPIN